MSANRKIGPPWEALTRFVVSAREFVVDFVRFAKTDGLKGTLLVGIGAVLEGAGLVLLVPILDAVMGHGNQSDWIGVHAGLIFRQLGLQTRAGKLAILLGFFTVLIALRALALWYRDIVLARLRIGFVEDQRTRLVGRLAQAPWAQLSKMQHSRINHLLSSDIMLTGSCVHFLLQSVVSLCLITMQCFIAFLFSPVLAIFAVCLMLGAGLVLIPQLIKSQTLGNAMVEGNLLLATSGAHFLGGLKLAISQNVQDRFTGEFGSTLRRLMQRQVAFVREQSKTQLTFGLLSSLLGAAAIFIGICVLGTDPSILIVFVLVLVRMGAPAAQLQQGAQQFANFLPSYEKVKALEAELLTDESAHVAASKLLIVNETIHFRHVSFRHSEDKGVFDLNLVIEPGCFLGVTGASGAGKTTFVDLLVGLIEAQEGAVFLGDKLLIPDIRRQWRSTIAYVPQDVFLFHDTIRGNLLWANTETKEEEIWAALQLAGADVLVSGLEHGLDTVIGEKGMMVSGGERQRLAIARAMIRKPPVLVLDEATSAIDVASEWTLLEALKTLPWQPTIVLIAHRTSSLIMCDRIVEFLDGRIVSDRRSFAPGMSVPISSSTRPSVWAGSHLVGSTSPSD